MRALEMAILYALEDDASDAPGYPTPDANGLPSHVSEPLADSPPQLVLDATLVPPLLSVASPEPLWLPYFRARLDKLISVLVISAFQLLWRPRNGTSVIKPADLIPREQSTDDQQHKLHLLQRLVTIIFQESGVVIGKLYFFTVVLQK
jgi:hypothetical protein